MEVVDPECAVVAGEEEEEEEEADALCGDDPQAETTRRTADRTRIPDVGSRSDRLRILAWIAGLTRLREPAGFS